LISLFFLEIYSIKHLVKIQKI